MAVLRMVLVMDDVRELQIAAACDVIEPLPTVQTPQKGETLRPWGTMQCVVTNAMQPSTNSAII